jgi:hypothetical protein
MLRPSTSGEHATSRYTYDLQLRGHASDAADPAITHRVLMIMLSGEY